MRKYLLILGLLLVFSCKRTDALSEEFGFNLFFENPQPINDSELAKIPNKFRGLFIGADSMYIKIEENVILSEFYNKHIFHKKVLDSIAKDYDLVDNHYVSKLSKDVFEYRHVGDSVEFSNKQVDTLFCFSNLQKAKRISGQLVLSYKDSVYWKVKTISLEKNSLEITYYYTQNDLKRIDSLANIKSIAIDSFSFISKPSRNEFKRILDLKRLGERRNYMRVK